MSHPRYVYAVFNFPGTTEEDLPLLVGERIEVISRDDEFGDGWWEGINERGQQGLFPKIYTAETYPSTSTAATSAAASQSSLSESLARVEEEPESEISMDNEEAREREVFVQGRTGTQATTAASTQAFEPITSIETVQSWAPAQVAEHFAQLGLVDVAPKFEEHEVSGRILLEMQHSDLKEIDINAFGKRFEIMKEIDALRRVDTTSTTLLQLQQDAGPSTPPLDFSSRSNARKSRILPQHSATGAVLAESVTSSEDRSEISSPKPSTAANSPRVGHDFAPLSTQESRMNHTRTDSGLGSSLNSTNANDSTPKSVAVAASKTHRKSLSTSSLALDASKAETLTGRRSPDKRHSRTWSQDTVKNNSHKRGASSGLGSVGEEVAASIASTDSMPRSPASPASATLTSPSSARPSLISKKSLLSRRQKWRPNAVSENLDNKPAVEAAKDADWSGWLRKRGEKSYNWKVRFFSTLR